MYEIIVGRDAEDKITYGDTAAFNLGKHYVKMGQTSSLSNNVLMDVVRSHVVFVAGKRGSGKCLHEDTMIPLENGKVVPIKDLADNPEKVLGLDHNMKIIPVQREGFYKRSVNKLLLIKLRSGKEIKLTPEHPLLTVLGWKPAQDLQKGSRIATPRKLPRIGSTQIPDYKIKILAYLIAEGHMRQSIMFANQDMNIVDDFTDAINQFDATLAVKKLTHGQYRVYRTDKPRLLRTNIKRNIKGQFSKGTSNSFQKSSIRKFLETNKLYGTLSTEREIPESILSLPKEKLSMFLNRLVSCDGSIYKSRKGNRFRWEISYSSSSNTLIMQVHHLLLRFGIRSTIRTKNIKINSKQFINYEIVLGSENLLKFIHYIGFFGDKKSKQLAALRETIVIKRNPNVDTVPKEFWSKYTPKNWSDIGRAMNYAHPKALRESQRYSISRQKLVQIAVLDQHEESKLLATSDIVWILLSCI